MNTFYLGLLAILCLTGCASEVHQMVRQDNSPFISGELVHDSGKLNRLVLKTPERHYEAHGFVVERQTNMAALYKRYHSINPKHWDRIFSRLDTDHITYSIKTIAKSVDGQELSCRIVWGAGARPAGVCTDQAGAILPVRFE